jgi:hypothetical protein
MKGLVGVNLSRTRVSDAGLARFRIPPSLVKITVSDTKVSDAAVEAIEWRYPDCHITR